MSLGVVVGRFQTDVLHEGHLTLLCAAREANDFVVVFLGTTPVRSKRNPLDYISRLNLFDGRGVQLDHIEDCATNEEWSANLDAKIATYLRPYEKATLYGGSHDSFLSAYTGRFDGVEVPVLELFSATEIRKRIACTPLPSKDFRRGVIYGLGNTYEDETAFQCVDAAVFNAKYTKVLLGRKRGETLLRFPGGFSSSDSDSLEEDVYREVAEECNGIDIQDVTYLYSRTIDDWRYPGPARIKSALFAARMSGGSPAPTDDLAGGTLDWYDVDKLTREEINPSHQSFLPSIKRYARARNPF